ncbi:MAG TPA: hypothetical protein VE981_03070 [Planctomycetota bacterium]|nr:hypothetical protein [Planctomycetota bacterium]
MQLNRISLRDPALGNIEGATLLVPEGWKIEGGFQWMPALSMQANLMVRVSDPSTGAAAETLPSQQFSWPLQDMGLPLQPGSNWNGSILLAPPPDAPTFVQGVLAMQSLPQLRGGKLLKVDDLPKLAAENARLAPPGFGIRCTRLRYAFQGWEEDVTVTLTFAPMNGWTAMWWCGGVTMRAPAGTLDAATPLLSVPMRSIRISLAWHAGLEEVRKVFAQGRLQSQQDFARFQQQWQQANAQIQEMHRQTWEDRAASQDRQNFALRELLGGVETYRSPYEHRNVELPAGYMKQWMHPDGTVLLSNDVNFDPRVAGQTDWRELQRFAP